MESESNWVLDVSFGEDQSRIRTGYAAQNLNVLRHMSLNLLKTDQSKKCGLKTKRKIAAWDSSYLLSLLGLDILDVIALDQRVWVVLRADGHDCILDPSERPSSRPPLASGDAAYWPDLQLNVNALVRFRLR